jgi:hypothetical protein
MNNSSLLNLSVNISNGWIIGCSILTCGIMTCAYLNSLSNISLLHMKRKFRLELQQSNLPSLTKDEDYDSEDLDDETWVAKKREFWKKNNISPLIIKGNSVTPEELTNLLREKE